MKKTLAALLLTGTTSLSAATPFVQGIIGFGKTNQLWKNDLKENTYTKHINLGAGMKLNDYFSASMNAKATQYDEELVGMSYEIYPRFTAHIPTSTDLGIYAGIGCGIAWNNITANGFTYPWKWTPQAFAGIEMKAGDGVDVFAGYNFYHLSHSFIGRYRCGGCNVGLNIDNAEFGVKKYIK